MALNVTGELSTSSSFITAMMLSSPATYMCVPVAHPPVI